jgi:hypothetical protein
MDALLILLQHLGLGPATYPVYDLIKGEARAATSEDELACAIQKQINMHEILLDAETVLRAVARNGLLSIRKSGIHIDKAVVSDDLRDSTAVMGNAA